MNLDLFLSTNSARLAEICYKRMLESMLERIWGSTGLVIKLVDHSKMFVQSFGSPNWAFLSHNARAGGHPVPESELDPQAEAGSERL